MIFPRLGIYGWKEADENLSCTATNALDEALVGTSGHSPGVALSLGLR